MIMWAMSDRTIPRSLRMMEGFGVNTFRLRQRERRSARSSSSTGGRSSGLQSTCWDEAVKIAGADPDYHRRDLFEAIAAGDFPEWEFGVQLFSQERGRRTALRHPRRDQADPGGADPDPDRRPHGAEPQPRQFLRRDRAGRLPADQCSARHRLLRRPAAAGPAVLLSGHPAVAPGHGQLPPDPDQRAEGLPLPEPAARRPHADAGLQGPRQLRAQQPGRGRRGGGPREDPEGGFRSFALPLEGTKVRLRAETFADHYSQARLFYRSQTEIEQAHICQRAGLRALQGAASSMSATASWRNLRNVDEDLAERVADGLDMPLPPKIAGRGRAAGHERLAGAAHRRQVSADAGRARGRRSWSPTAPTARSSRP